VFLFGLLADLIGAGFLLLLFYLGSFGDDIVLTVMGLIGAGVCIFVFNYYISFKKYEKKIKFNMAITLAITTTPYTFLIPTAWIYNF